MKKLMLVIASAVIAFGFGIAQAKDAPKGPVSIKTEGGKKGAVSFDHANHKDQKCEDCHHAAKEGKFKCRECHKLEDDAKTKAPKIETAMHGKDKGACFKCHRAEDAKHKLKCADCHK